MPCCSPGHVTDHPRTCGTPREQYHQWSQTATVSVSTICQSVPPQAVGQHQLHEQRLKKRDARRLIRVKTPRPKTNCEVAVALRGREHGLTLSWGRDLQLRSSSANSLGPSPPPIRFGNHKGSTTHSTTQSVAIPVSLTIRHSLRRTLGFTLSLSNRKQNLITCLLHSLK